VKLGQLANRELKVFKVLWVQRVPQVKLVQPAYKVRPA
jgi:hypothetical protein